MEFLVMLGAALLFFWALLGMGWWLYSRFLYLDHFKVCAWPN